MKKCSLVAYDLAKIKHIIPIKVYNGKKNIIVSKTTFRRIDKFTTRVFHTENDLTRYLIDQKYITGTVDDYDKVKLEYIASGKIYINPIAYNTCKLLQKVKLDETGRATTKEVDMLLTKFYDLSTKYSKKTIIFELQQYLFPKMPPTNFNDIFNKLRLLILGYMDTQNLIKLRELLSDYYNYRLLALFTCEMQENLDSNKKQIALEDEKRILDYYQNKIDEVEQDSLFDIEGNPRKF